MPTTLELFAKEFDRRFVTYLTPPAEVPANLLEAVRYSALSPGKRIRPYLVARCCELVGGATEITWPIAAAVECMHAFSLIHDDLPAMDDDDLRRGLPTCHRKYGEAIAILAGDALAVLAFELIGRETADRTLAASLVLELARSTGWSGMIGGQAADVIGQSQHPTLSTARYIHERKTASLFAAAARMGAMLGHGSAPQITALGRFGEHLGRSFQIADDLLDLTASRDSLGKEVGRDAAMGKQTYPQCVGMEASRGAAQEAMRNAADELASFGAAADDLRSLAEFVVHRDC